MSEASTTAGEDHADSPRLTGGPYTFRQVSDEPDVDIEFGQPGVQVAIDLCPIRFKVPCPCMSFLGEVDGVTFCR